MNKLNFDNPLPNEDIFALNRNKRGKKYEDKRRDSKLDVSAKVDFGFSRAVSRINNAKLNFRRWMISAP